MSDKNTTTATSQVPTTASQTHEELVTIARENPQAITHIQRELSKEGLALTADFKIVEIKKPLFSRKDVQDAADDGEAAAERALESIKSGLTTFGERTTLYLVDLPKEALHNRAENYRVNKAARLSKWEQRKAERRAARAAKRAENERERAVREAKEAQEAAARAAQRAAEAQAAQEALEGGTTPI